jgi:hypothetical protein
MKVRDADGNMPLLLAAVYAGFHRAQDLRDLGHAAKLISLDQFKKGYVNP